TGGIYKNKKKNKIFLKKNPKIFFFFFKKKKKTASNGGFFFVFQARSLKSTRPIERFTYWKMLIGADVLSRWLGMFAAR
ncbi:hypothetical protein, partial [Vibrio parahaemolyticus]|uniref:hypothetical protein n=1 Tax=Vibrio parahaemolyticus TaxID=670 RepID=UPI001F4F0E7C